MCTGADSDILKNTDIDPPHIQLRVPESVVYPKTVLPHTLELCPNHALCL